MTSSNLHVGNTIKNETPCVVKKATMPEYDPPANAHYTQLDVSEYPDGFMWKAIGKEGRNFYRITDWLKLKYVWYDDKRNVVEIWGPEHALQAGARDKVAKVLKMYSEILV